MESNDSEQDFSHLQDVMSSFPMIKRYIPIILSFPMDESVSVTEVERHLRDGLSRLADAFPYFAGKVVIEGQTETNTGITRIKPLDKEIPLIVKNLRIGNDSDAGEEEVGTFPSMEEIQKAKYPFSMLPSSILCPSIVASWTTAGPEAIAPVLVLQANFIRGGLLLSINGNHMIMDMTGWGIVIEWLAKACRNDKPFTETEIQNGNRDRRNVIPLFGPDWQPDLVELDDVLVKQPSSSPGGSQLTTTTVSPPRWAYFLFDKENLARLKHEATTTNTLAPYISTDDAIGAFCWQRISLARSKRFPPSSFQTTFCRVINTRHLFPGLSSGYIGHMVDCVYSHWDNKNNNNVDIDNENINNSPISVGKELWNQPLGLVAARLRLLLQPPSKLKHHMQSFATLLSRLPNKSQLINGANLDLDRDVVISSYGNTRVCEFDFGFDSRNGKGVGKAEAARQPDTAPWPGLGCVMAKDGDGSVAVGICLSERDLDRLRGNKVFTGFGKYVG